MSNDYIQNEMKWHIKMKWEMTLSKMKRYCTKQNEMTKSKMKWQKGKGSEIHWSFIKHIENSLNKVKCD